MSTTTEKMAVMAHYEAGKQIQHRRVGAAVWLDCICPPRWDWADYEYRVRLEEEVIMRTTTMLCYLHRGELHWRSERCAERVPFPSHSVRVPSEDKTVTYAIPGSTS